MYSLFIKSRKGASIMLVTIFGIACLAFALLNIGYCLFDHE